MGNEVRDPVPHTLRPMGAGDEGFVYDSWLRSCRLRAPSPDEFFRTQRRVIETALLGEGRVMVAHWEDDADHLLGFVAARGRVVHYVFVKQPFRRRGLGLSLLQHVTGEDREVFTTHMQNLPASWRNGRRFEHNPSLIFGD